MDDKDMFIPHNETHSCWWPGDGRSQGISIRAIVIVLPKYPSLSIRRVNYSWKNQLHHYNDVIMGAKASQINRLFRRRSKKISKLCVTGLCVRGIHRGRVNSPHKGPVTRKMLPFDDVIMSYYIKINCQVKMIILLFLNLKQTNTSLISVYDISRNIYTAFFLIM